MPEVVLSRVNEQRLPFSGSRFCCQDLFEASFEALFARRASF